MTGLDDRALAWGIQLVEVHDWLREQLATLRDGSTMDKPSLRVQCESFCTVLSGHHADEDDGLFPALARQYPELGPLLDELRRDHRTVADIVARLSDLDSAALPRELDGLAAVLESHLSYEERKLVTILDALPPRPDLAPLTRRLPSAIR